MVASWCGVEGVEHGGERGERGERGEHSGRVKDGGGT